MFSMSAPGTHEKEGFIFRIDRSVPGLHHGGKRIKALCCLDRTLAVVE